MAVRVNTNELLPEVLKCLCEMRDMNPDNYMFDLPSAMNAADKTLQQLATNRVKIVPRAAGKCVWGGEGECVYMHVSILWIRG